MAKALKNVIFQSIPGIVSCWEISKLHFSSRTVKFHLEKLPVDQQMAKNLAAKSPNYLSLTANH